MAATGYGSHPYRLESLLGTLNDDEKAHVRPLDGAESGRFESESLDLLPQTSWGTINWDDASFLEQHTTEHEKQAASLLQLLVHRHVQIDSNVVVFWGNLVVPSLEIPARLIADNAEEVLAVSHDVWIFAPSERVVIEYFHDGQLTVAEVPQT